MYEQHVVEYYQLRTDWLRATYIMPWNEYVRLMFC